MRKYFAIILLFSLVVLSYFNVKNLANVVNTNNISIDNIENNSSSNIMFFKIDELDNIINSLGLEIHSKNYVSDRLIIEGYSQKLSNYVVVNNLKTNIQISVDGEKIIVGYPLIKDSF